MASAVETACGIEMAVTFPVAQALAHDLHVPHSPEKWVFLSPPFYKGGT